MNLQNSIQTADTFNGFMQTTGGTSGLTGTDQFTWMYPVNSYYYHSSCWHTPENKTEQAFKIIRALMKAKALEIKTLNQFFEAMDEVVKAL